MNEPGAECARIRPLLFAAAEGAVDREERLEVQTHLAVCAACRSWDREERALTALLSGGVLPWPARRSMPQSMHQPVRPRRVRQRVLAFAGALGLVAMLVLLLPAATPHGSLLEQRLGRDLRWQVSGERTLRADEAFALETEYVTRYPEGGGIAAVRFWMAVHHLEQGRHQDARELFERVRRDEGDSALGQAARSNLGMLERDQDTAPAADATAPSPASQGPGEDSMTTRRALPADAERCAYLVVPVALDAARQADAGYLAAARAAAGFHGAEAWAWDGVDFAALRDRLLRLLPENVLFVLRPAQLDLVLHRRLLLLCAGIDDDWFVDVAFGYLTAEDGAGCERLWQRIERLHERGHLSGLWWQGSVTSNPTSLVYEDGAGPLVKAAGFRGPHYYWSTANADRDAMIERSFATLPQAAVVELTGCGDPQGIWLFDDRRNLQRDRHWDYAPERVGHDPGHEMPRLLARRFRALQLDAPILWSGTCHSGAVCNVFVEGDIVATFGRTTAATVHELAPEDSLALSWLAAGAAGMLVPIGSNHGMSVAMETDFALRHGASLGEVVKSTWDDVLLAAQGRFVLDLPVAGQAHQPSEAVMQGGGANRILIGDPALRPFRRVASAAERVAALRTAAGLRVQVERAEGWQPRAWDIYGTMRDRDWRALVRVDLVEAGVGECTEFTARVTARGPDGAALPYAIARVAVEDHHGRRFLHLQANGPRALLEHKAATIMFDVVAK